MGSAGIRDLPGQGIGRGALLGVLVVAISLALVASLGTRGAEAQTVISAEATNRSDEVLDYWTAKRLREARPLDATPSAGVTGSAEDAAVSRSAKPVYVEGSEPGSAGEPRVRSGRVGDRVGRGAQASGHVPFTIEAVTDTASFPSRTHGKVFATLPRFGDFVCSGTVVPGNTHSTVMTAGHCVFANGSGFASNWIFVPGYNDGAQPHGAWVAKQLAAPNGFVKNDGNVTLDVGAAELLPDSEGRLVEEVVGSRGVAFNQPRGQSVDAYGYPAEPLAGLPFNGEQLWTCDTEYGGDDFSTSGLSGPLTLRIGCPMSAGSSGGGWVFGEETAGSGFVESVVSYGYPEEPNHLYGPYFGAEARKVWVAAQDGCKGRLATHVGTDGADQIKGTSGADVIVAKGGNDRVNGRGGNDRICGGDGNDKLRGKGGRDKLDGAAGRDLLSGGGGGDNLDGGSGRDSCTGGGGRDKDRRCEKTRSLP